MYQTIRDAQYFLESGIIEHRNTTNTTAEEQFLTEVDLELQIQETESACE